ncbi:broad-complex core protein isoforms 1/2/3/4/5-like isoform X3 [Apis laboriosa]|uniref:broad-complex core protein isoforms 1/2/3/4/5-like isoform X3 n=1 Tax=Apis laboriosa TaxID=183418 RepID=UPI001CC568CD|nr:broad-complex core protein isoforms 1/2/3/4/5-like isoform X3 [Apis laboriosa]XP_061939886.1 broad-complex core protein isoforms 1/2/3/4/5 isoform X5 [Apis cerana]
MAASSSSSSGEQQYSLRWNDFHSSILSSFRHLRDEEDFVDVTLACDSSSFTAHKVVLSACSPYFRRLLKANPCQHPIVILRDVASSDMESLLRFMYHGEVHVGQEQLAAFLKTAQMLQVRGLADVNSGAAKIPPPSSSGGNNGSAPATPRNPWQDNGRGELNESGLSPPPEKRPRSYSPPLGNHVEPKTDLQESLLGQALAEGPTIHTTPTNNVQAQSTGEDSNSMSDNEEEMSNNDSILNSVKTEPSDILNDSMEHHRNSFPALLGIPGLIPGPSGIHAANQDPNYDHGLDEAEGAAYHHHHSHHQQHHRHRHHHPLSVPPPHHHHHQALQEDDQQQQQQQQQQDQSTTTASTTNTTTTKYQRSPADYRQQKMIRDHHQQHGYRCPLCCRTLQDISTMRAHLEHHYPRDSPTCPVASCAKTFSHPNSVRNHMRLKHPVQWDQIKTLRWTYV